MRPLALLRPVGWALTSAGILSLAIAGLLAAPLSQPPALASIHAGRSEERRVGKECLE